MSDPADMIAAKIYLAKAIADGKPPKLPLKLRRRLEARPDDKQELQKWMREILGIYAVNEASVAAKLSEGLQAYKVVETQTGQMIKVPDYFTQHKFLETAVKILDLYPPTKQQLTTDEGGIVVRLTPAFGASENGHDELRYEVVNVDGEATEED